MELDWYKCKGDVWCELFKLDINHKYLKGLAGVYLIWSGATEKTCLKVGSGSIQEELRKHAKDIALNAFATKGVYVTWAEVSAFKRKGVQAFIAEKLNPKFDDNPSKSSPVEVDMPW